MIYIIITTKKVNCYWASSYCKICRCLYSTCGLVCAYSNTRVIYNYAWVVIIITILDKIKRIVALPWIELFMRILYLVINTMS